MASPIDMSLDELTLKNQQGSSSSSSSKLGRRPANAVVGRHRHSPYPLPTPVPVAEPVILGGNPAAGTKLYLSNLDHGVSDQDIYLLFSDVGMLKRYGLHYDKTGRSKGTAEVVFERKVDAVAAIKRYNNVNLDGKPLRIELIGVNLAAPFAMPVADPSSLVEVEPYGNSRRTGASQDGGSGKAGGHDNLRDQGQRRDITWKPTKEDLDAELERYHMEAPARARKRTR